MPPELDVTRNRETWHSWIEPLELNDPYYDFNYLEAWADDPYSELLGIRFNSRKFTVLYPVIRESLRYLDSDIDYCDIRTPYDFGGPIAFGTRSTDKEQEFYFAWLDLVKKWEVITEFNRLHPYRQTLDLDDQLFHADNIQVDLSVGYDQIHKDYHTNQRNRLRNADDVGLRAEVNSAPDESTVEAFLTLYYETMMAVDASADYFYRPRVLRNVINHDAAVLVSVYDSENIIASGIFLTSDEEIFFFLSGSDRSELDKRPNNLMLDKVVRWGVEQNYRLFHLGGGSEGLRHFKAQIGNSRVPYFIRKSVHNQAAYEQLCSKFSVGKDADFPEYRERKFSNREIPPNF